MFDWLKRKQLLTLPERDIHNHLLPGVDDGFRSADSSLQAISRMVEKGVREIVFTPHMNPDVYPNESEAHFREVFASFCPQVTALTAHGAADRLELSERKNRSPLTSDPSPLTAHGAADRPEHSVGKNRSPLPSDPSPLTANRSTLTPQLHLAAEYMVVKDFEKRVSSHADELLVYPDNSILIEMSYFYRSRNFEDTIFELNMAGLRPIVAHPERYLYMADSLRDYDKWVDMGARLQLNLLSLTGTYGPASMKILRHLLDHQMYSFAATDLHTLSQLDRILSSKVDSKLLNSLTANHCLA